MKKELKGIAIGAATISAYVAAWKITDRVIDKAFDKGEKFAAEQKVKFDAAKAKKAADKAQAAAQQSQTTSTQKVDVEIVDDPNKDINKKQ